MKVAFFLFYSVFLFALSGCTKGGSGDGDSNRLSNNACSDLGLGSRSFERIVNGTNCDATRSQVVRLVFIGRGTQTGFCSGTMITGNDVLTAAHCFLGNPVRVVMITGRSLEDSREFEAVNWSIHPGFRAGGTLAFDDVAVVHLELNTDLPTVPILTSQNVSSGEVVGIFGYGTDENGNFDFEDLEAGEMRISDVTRTHIGADFSGEGSNTCTGDSGGPVISHRLGFPAIAGVTSTGTQLDCLEGDTTFFANMSSQSIIDFLRRVVPDAGFR